MLIHMYGASWSPMLGQGKLLQYVIRFGTLLIMWSIRVVEVGVVHVARCTCWGIKVQRVQHVKVFLGVCDFRFH